MFSLYRRFLRWSGLNRSTPIHIRIRGYVFSRLLIGSVVGTTGFGFIHAGILMGPNVWDVVFFLFGASIFILGMKIMRPWILMKD